MQNQLLDQKQAWSDQLNQWVQETQHFGEKGNFVDYIPDLIDANRTDLGVTVMGMDGTTLHAGQWPTYFTYKVSPR